MPKQLRSTGTATKKLLPIGPQSKSKNFLREAEVKNFKQTIALRKNFLERGQVLELLGRLPEVSWERPEGSSDVAFEDGTITASIRD